MDHLINTEDSYAERRQLFKNIWEAAMNIDDKDNDIASKPKVIKTLRLDEEDRLEVNNKKKKLKLRNLREVCNKILDFCDRQEADDMFYEKLNITCGAVLVLRSATSRRVNKMNKTNNIVTLFEANNIPPEVIGAFVSNGIRVILQTHSRAPQETLSSSWDPDTLNYTKKLFEIIRAHMNVEGYVRKHLSPDLKIKKGKTVRSKKKTKKSKSLISQPKSPADAEVISDGHDDLNATLANETPKDTTLKIKQTAKRSPIHKAITKRASAINPPKKMASHRKVVKKGTKTKKQSLSQVSQPPGTILRAEIVRKP